MMSDEEETERDHRVSDGNIILMDFFFYEITSNKLFIYMLRFTIGRTSLLLIRSIHFVQFIVIAEL